MASEPFFQSTPPQTSNDTSSVTSEVPDPLLEDEAADERFYEALAIPYFDAPQNVLPRQASVGVPEPVPSALDVPTPVAARDLISKLSSIYTQQRTQALKPVQRRRGPPDVLIAAAGDGTFGIQMAEWFNAAVMVHPDADVIQAAKARPLGSHGSIVRIRAEKGRSAPEFRQYPIRPGLQYVHAHPENTGLPEQAFDFVVIEQPYRLDAARLHDEIRRVARIGAAVVLMDYPMPRVNPQIDGILDLIYEKVLSKCLSNPEKHSLTRAAAIELPFREEPNLLPQHPEFSRKLVMRAKWNLPTFIKHLNDWPVIRRIEDHSPMQVDLWIFRDLLKDAWGSKGHRREITWPVTLRAGFVD